MKIATGMDETHTKAKITANHTHNGVPSEVAGAKNSLKVWILKKRESKEKHNITSKQNNNLIDSTTKAIFIGKKNFTDCLWNYIGSF